jgi:DEAD/DEAH box helicase domain-containing protein
MFGKWQQRTNNPMLSLYSGIAISKAKANRSTPYTVFAVIDDKTDPANEKFEMEWNVFWLFVNVLQFNPEFSFVTAIGLEKMIYIISRNGIDAFLDSRGWFLRCKKLKHKKLYSFL